MNHTQKKNVYKILKCKSEYGEQLIRVRDSPFPFYIPSPSLYGIYVLEEHPSYCGKKKLEKFYTELAMYPSNSTFTMYMLSF